MNLKEFRHNRSRFPIDELKKHDGKWVAFSMDGRRIIASSSDLESLDAKVIAAGINPEEAALERVEFDNASFGGAEADLMLQFSYQDEPLVGAAPPSLPAGATIRWRPLVATLVGPSGKRRFFTRTLIDSGADDSVFPMSLAVSL